MTKKTAPYGTWISPITSELIVSGSINAGAASFDGDDIYWLESRPSEGGRAVVVRERGRVDMIPAPFNARSRVHEYAGGSYVVSDGTVYFANFSDQRMYRTREGEQPVAVTPESQRRFADLLVDARRNRLICVCEDHAQADQEPENSLVAIDLESGDVTTLAHGDDFYSSPRLSPDSRELAWISWKHPDMPWDATTLWLAELDDDGLPVAPKIVAGGTDESILQPEWSPGGRLYFVSDRTGWWNIYRFAGTVAEPVLPMEAEFGYPPWQFGYRFYGFSSEDVIVCAHTSRGTWRLGTLDLRTGTLSEYEGVQKPSSIDSLSVAGNRVLFEGGSAERPGGVYLLDLESNAVRPLRLTTELAVDPRYVSIPEAITFETGGGQSAHALYYPPKNDDYEAPEGEKPPLIVKSHGGPTSCATNRFSFGVQYWTSRGFGLVDVDYGGSCGYGTAYRRRLNGQWGIVDVNDCARAAEYLAERGLADRERLIIKGGSAGGYTTLCALTFTDVFKAGASHYGIGDLETLARDTHKFESRYLDRMVGPYPQSRETYRERSPIHYTDQLNCPIIFFQGLDDKVVPPNQAEDMVKALKAKGLPVAYVPFEGEGHGFRAAANMKMALDAELYFYSRVFGFTLPGAPVEITIDNM